LTNPQEYEKGSREDFLKKLKDGEYDNVVGLYRSNNSTSVRPPALKFKFYVLTEELLHRKRDHSTRN
jgi:hypothetical protein